MGDERPFSLCRANSSCLGYCLPTVSSVLVRVQLLVGYAHWYGDLCIPRSQEGVDSDETGANEYEESSMADVAVGIMIVPYSQCVRRRGMNNGGGMDGRHRGIGE